MRDEYDFSDGVRGKYAACCAERTKIMAEITTLTDDEGPRLLIEGCGFCGEWRVSLWETACKGRDGPEPEGSCVQIGSRFEDILDAADLAEYWGRILGLRVQTDPDHLEHLREQEKALEPKKGDDHA